MPISVAILVSGRGSNMKAILEAVKSGELDAEVSVVLSNTADAPALETARSYGVKSVAIPSKGKNREQHEQEVLDCLSAHKVDFVVLAGYMRVLTPHFLRPFKHPNGYYRVINIHPSMLPAYPGANAYDDAFNANVPVSGITIHLVDEQVDHGPILAQEAFSRMENDTLETFKQRGLAIEHRLYPRVLQQIAAHGIDALLGNPEKANAAVSLSGGEAR